MDNSLQGEMKKKKGPGAKQAFKERKRIKKYCSSLSLILYLTVKFL